MPETKVESESLSAVGTIYNPTILKAKKPTKQGNLTVYFEPL
jgi:hypothetical protein